MQGQQEVRSHIGAGLGTLAAAVLIATGMSACDYGPETRDLPQNPGQDVQPDPQLGARQGDVDISARSTEAGNAARNEAAAREEFGSSDAGSEEPEVAVAQTDDAAVAIVETDQTAATAETDETAATAENDETAATSENDGNNSVTADEQAEASTQVAAAGSPATVTAFAVLEPTEGNEARGDASFVETEEGLEIVVTMTQLTPGQHAVHVHENGDCSGPAAEAAGDHFNPGGSPHGAPSDDPSERHAGDLGNFLADSTGLAELNLTVENLAVEGERGVAGRAIIVHAGEDDFSSQPSGQSGDPISCGVIEARGRG